MLEALQYLLMVTYCRQRSSECVQKSWEIYQVSADLAVRSGRRGYVQQQQCHVGPAAEEEDSYTKEETKTPRFVNLVHAASIQKQQVPGQPAMGNAHTPRAAAYAHEEAFSQQSAEQLERSGLVTSSLPEPLQQQVSLLIPAFPQIPPPLLRLAGQKSPAMKHRLTHSCGRSDAAANV